MMDDYQIRTVEKRDELSAGHYMKWETTLPHASFLRSWYFAQNYQTFCYNFPTFWGFQIWFPVVSEDGTALLSAFLQRYDNHGIQMEASFWVEICTPDGKPIYTKGSFTKSDMIPGYPLQETVQIENVKNLYNQINQNVVVSVTLAVCFCHSDEVSEYSDYSRSSCSDPGSKM